VHLEKRIAYLHTKRIKAADIRKILNIIEKEYEALQQSHKVRAEKKELSPGSMAPNAKIWLLTEDNIEYRYFLEDFKTTDVLDTKVIIRVICNLEYRKEGIDLNISFSDSLATNYRSFIEIEGSDPTSVSGLLNRLLERTNSFEKQNILFRRFKWPISIILGILGGYFLGWISVLPISLESQLRSLVFTIVMLSGFLAISLLLENFLDKLWPDIEIVPSQEHERILDKRRGYLKWVITAIIIPFAISAFFTWIRN